MPKQRRKQRDTKLFNARKKIIKTYTRGLISIGT